MAELGVSVSAVNCTHSLPDAVASYVCDSLAPNTRRAYLSDLAELERGAAQSLRLSKQSLRTWPPALMRWLSQPSAGGDGALFSYIIDWMASGVQHPDSPGRSALSLRGVPGCGKGVFALGYGHLFGQHFLHARHRDHVIGKFNAHQAETC